MTAVQLGAGGARLAAVRARRRGRAARAAAAGPVVAVLALALAGTALAFWLFAWAQARVPAELAGAFVNLEPLVGALTGAVAFHDAFGPLAAGRRRGDPRRHRARRAAAAATADRPAVAEEAAGRPVIRERRRPHDPGRAVAHRPSAGPPMSVATQPGHTAFTSTPSRASASASMSVSAFEGGLRD